MPNNETVKRNYPLPHPDNKLSEDVGRISDAFSKVDDDVDALDVRTQQMQQDFDNDLAEYKQEVDSELDQQDQSHSNRTNKNQFEAFIGLGVIVV